MLMEELFSTGVMTMGPSRVDPARQVGVFRPELLATLPGIRAAEMEKIGWRIYLLMRGAYGMLRSAEGWVDGRLVFTGEMTMLGPTRLWRLTLTRDGDDRFSYVNEEQTPDGAWAYIDRWDFTRKNA
ncbi:hypothetical protein DYQ86_23810 [Acidobacteria bacterium AB60]|nr:hypothetical protein DYQ86_23810 [Acidobacteria bacterium AB60]